MMPVTSMMWLDHMLSVTAILYDQALLKIILLSIIQYQLNNERNGANPNIYNTDLNIASSIEGISRANFATKILAHSR